MSETTRKDAKRPADPSKGVDAVNTAKQYRSVDARRRLFRNVTLRPIQCWALANAGNPTSPTTGPGLRATYELLAQRGEAMTAAATVPYACDHIEQA